MQHTLTEAYIKQLNQLILVRSFWKEAITEDGQATRRLIKVGEYKEYPNSVRLQNGELFEYASPIDTPIKMGELIQWFNTEIEKKELHPVTLAALLHYKFVLIHPFDDGNGRISRLLMNYVLLKNNLPPVIIKTQDKKKYLNALNQADTGNTAAFIKYIAEQVIWSIETQIKATKGESIEELDDVDKEVLILQKRLKQQNEIAKKRTPDFVKQVLVHNIFYLIDKIELKLKPLFQFFIEITKEIEYEEYNSNSSKKFQFTSDVEWYYFKCDPFGNKFMLNNNNIKLFKYNLNLKILKSLVNEQCYLIGFEIYFNDYNFSIKTYNRYNQTTIYQYGINQSLEVLENIANGLVKDIIEVLKKEINK